MWLGKLDLIKAHLSSKSHKSSFYIRRCILPLLYELAVNLGNKHRKYAANELDFHRMRE
jgi:hypothetical protein